MINKKMGKYSMPLLVVAVIFAISMLSSCIGSRPVNYFNGSVDTSKLNNIKMPDPIIQKGDMLSITIYSDNPEATAIFNQAGGAAVAPMNTTGVSRSVDLSPSSGSGSSGYLVDIQGNIRMQEIGLIKVEGLTKEQLNEQILERLNKLGVLTNPYTVIRLNNFKITVLGEVKSPGVFTLPGEKASILEVIGLAGDISEYGLKDKVLLIREDRGSRSYHRLGLTDANIFCFALFLCETK
jgi:polysaccharide export outer membrane protein